MICCTSAGMAGRTDDARGAASAVPARSAMQIRMRLSRRKRFIEDLRGLSNWMRGRFQRSPSVDLIVDDGKGSAMVTLLLLLPFLERRLLGFLRRIYDFRAVARPRTWLVNSASFNDSRLISTFASAPSMAALASALAVVKSDFILGLVMGNRASAIRATSRDRSATPSGTLVACFSAGSTMPSAAADSRAFL